MKKRNRNVLSHLSVWLPSRGNVILTTLAVIGLVLWVRNTDASAVRVPSVTSTSIEVIAYQGRLTDANGRPLTGTYDMVFRLYDVSSGGISLWEESWTGSNSVMVGNGLFNVMLGSLVPVPQAVIAENDTLWLGITVDADAEMTPRVQLGSVPYTMQASSALTVPPNSITDLEIADNAVGGGEISDGAVTTADVADGAITNAKLGLGGVLDLNADGSLTADSGNIVVRHDHTSGNVRLIAGQSLWAFIDTDDSQTDASFRIYHNNGSVNPPVETLLGLNENGDLWILGNYSSGAFVENNLQTPDELASERILRFSQGDVLCWVEETHQLEKCSSIASPLIVAVASERGKPIVLGAESVKVLGPVQAGDLLVASATPGYSISWSQVGEGDPPTGIIIAKALESFDGGRGLIKAMILGR